MTQKQWCEQMRELCRKMESLLAAEEYGLTTWWMMVQDRAEEFDHLLRVLRNDGDEGAAS